MDGFRHDYIDTVRRRFGPAALPNFHHIEKSGIRAGRSINVYPTITFPNHQTLVTGLYAQHHGVVGNVVNDMNFPNATLEMDSQESLNTAPWLLEWPEPIWVTLQKAGRRVGSMLWPLADGMVQGYLPFQQVSEYSLLNGVPATYPYYKRVSDVLWWLKNPYYHLDFVMLYFDEPDSSGHLSGPESLEVAKRVVELDDMLGQLLDGLRERHLSNKVDIIITADHGMTAISTDRLIPLDRYVDASLYTYTQYSTLGFLYPKSGQEEVVYNALKNKDPNLQVYRRSEVPGYLHFNISNSRMPVLVLIPSPGWYIVHTPDTYIRAGDHGYSTNFTDMHPFFLATGPSFSVNKTIPEVHAVDVYPLLCGLLGVTANPNNGSLERISHVLKPRVARRLLSMVNSSPWWRWLVIHEHQIWSFTVLLLLLTVVLTLLALSLMKRRRYHDRVVVVYNDAASLCEAA